MATQKNSEKRATRAKKALHDERANHLVSLIDTMHPEKRAFIMAYQNTLGNIGKACEQVRIHRRTYSEWRKRDPEFDAALRLADEYEKDWWENQLKIAARGMPKYDAEGNVTGYIVRPDVAAIIFGTKIRCRDRGYVERQIHTLETDTTPRIDLNRLTADERETWFKLLDKATPPVGELL